jgi:hypothetical protein
LCNGGCIALLQSLSCELCNVKVTSTKILQRHLEGRRHKMKAERKGKTFICELCDVVANSEIQLNIHLNSKTLQIVGLFSMIRSRYQTQEQTNEKGTKRIHNGAVRRCWSVDIAILCRLYFY